MRVFGSLEDVRGAENPEPGRSLALERVMGDLATTYVGAGCLLDPDTERPVVLAERGIIRRATYGLPPVY
jgi:hypothetical protein